MFPKFPTSCHPFLVGKCHPLWFVRPPAFRAAVPVGAKTRAKCSQPGTPRDRANMHKAYAQVCKHTVFPAPPVPDQFHTNPPATPT